MEGEEGVLVGKRGEGRGMKEGGGNMGGSLGRRM